MGRSQMKNLRFISRSSSCSRRSAARAQAQVGARPPSPQQPRTVAPRAARCATPELCRRRRLCLRARRSSSRAPYISAGRARRKARRRGRASSRRADQAYNPASAVKLVDRARRAAHASAPKHRFATAIWITGTFDKTTGTVTGDLIVSGRDPSFHYEHAVAVARELNQLGIRTVTGDLVVAPRFTMNFSASSLRSGERFYDTLDSTRRPRPPTRAWNDSRVALDDAGGAA